MARIIVIESDYRRRRRIGLLVREYVKADLKVAESVADAVPLMREKTPDVVIAPTLLSPKDSADLIAHVNDLQAPYVQLLTLPALDMLGEEPKEEPAGLRSLMPFGRRRAPLGPQYDRAMVGAQIADAVERARAARLEYQSLLQYRVELEELAKQQQTALALTNADEQTVRRVVKDLRSADERRTARRRALQEIPWVSNVKLAWDAQIELVNISTSGVLVETGSKFTPGSTTELHLNGSGGALVVPVRFIRSEIARIDNLGVKYRAAAAFEREIDLSAPRRQVSGPATPPEALAQLLAATLADGQAAEPAPVRFARGVRNLVGARDVQVRASAGSGSGGRETLYFDVPGDNRVRTTLQVTFDRGHHVTPSEFQLLKAAAWLTAAALEFDRPLDAARKDDGSIKLLTERVA